MQTRVRTLERVGRLKRTSILELGKVPLNGNGNSNGNGNGHAILRGHVKTGGRVLVENKPEVKKEDQAAPDGVMWGPIGKEVYERTYSRLKADGTHETWLETVRRVVDGNLALVDSKFHEHGERDKLYKLISKMDMIPAGRHLWATGVPGRQYLANCHSAGFSRKDLTAHFVFTFDELMKGGGVGSNYSNKYINIYPPLFSKVDLHIVCNPSHPNIDEVKPFLSPKHNHLERERYVVDDSREGWCGSLAELLRAAWDGKDGALIIDVSPLRERGAQLKSFGGISSGPAPLVSMLSSVAKTVNAKVGQKLSSLDFMAIDHEIATCVVSGNIRRSARMSIKHWDDPDIFEFVFSSKRFPPDGANRGHYRNPFMDALTDQIRVEPGSCRGNDRMRMLPGRGAWGGGRKDRGGCGGVTLRVSRAGKVSNRGLPNEWAQVRSFPS